MRAEPKQKRTITRLRNKNETMINLTREHLLSDRRLIVKIKEKFGNLDDE